MNYNWVNLMKKFFTPVKKQIEFALCFMDLFCLHCAIYSFQMFTPILITIILIKKLSFHNPKWFQNRFKFLVKYIF